MSTTWSGIITAIGLLLAIVGVVCGAKAYRGTLREHDPDPSVWPWAARQLQRARALIPGLKRDHPAAAHLTSFAHAEAAAATGAAADLTVRSSSETLDERLARIEDRVEKIAEKLVANRSALQREVDALSSRIVEQGSRLDAADAGLEQLAKRVAVSSVRLQLAGLILVGAGTICMAVPAIYTMIVS